MSKKYSIGKSQIHGVGIISARPIKVNERIDVGIDYYFLLFPYVTEGFGSLINHSHKPNTTLIYEHNKYYVVATANIQKGEEITINYDKCPWFIMRSMPWYK